MANSDCAETVLHIVQPGEDRPRNAIETARAWCLGRATHADVQSALAGTRNASRAAKTFAAADAAAAADVAFPTNTVFRVAASMKGVSRDATYHALAPLIERWIPLPVVLLSQLGYPDAIPFDPAQVTTRENGRRRAPRR
jgi:hypothetical protein